MKGFYIEKCTRYAALFLVFAGMLGKVAVAASDIQSQNMLSTKLVAVVKSMERATLSSQIDSVVSAVNYLPGDRFNRGDVLLSIDCTLPNAELNKAKAQVEAARNEFKSLDALHNLNSATIVEVAKSAS